MVWAFDRFGAIVAALRNGPGPLVLLADHRPTGECRRLYAVPDLALGIRGAVAAGATGIVEVGIPPGPCVIFDGPGGELLGLIEETRPERMEESFRSLENVAALRPPWPHGS